MNFFAGNASPLPKAINNMLKSLPITGAHNVTVSLNGAEVLGRLTPEIQSMVVEQVRVAVVRVFKEQMPDAGVQI
jgi:hypothetical protein